MVEYPEIAWKPYQFAKSPNFWWAAVGRGFRLDDPISLSIMRDYIEELAESYNLHSKSDWERFIAAKKPQTVMNRLNETGPLVEILAKLYPQWFSSSQGTPV